ncbi:hypothetical protein F2Q70_00010387 [Brassica cretica]|uniref:Uncharacterized protein n=1 Tax=Brassica cretica TaxID=69181 RepID=A0A3N6SKI5_BRACR|nr:hypothetical protein F2Q70_00010387 [Brassica cretica]KAF3551240.1 hypothetical protein DY000_02005019 [Brassica cretica]
MALRVSIRAAFSRKSTIPFTQRVITLDSLTTTTSEIGGTNSSATSGTQGPNDSQFLHLLRLSGDQPRDNPVEKEAPPDRQSLSHFAQVSKILPITKSRKFPNNVR